MRPSLVSYGVHIEVFLFFAAIKRGAGRNTCFTLLEAG